MNRRYCTRGRGKGHRLATLYGRGCLMCGCRYNHPFTVDHVLPLARGGTNTFENLQPLCLRCNNAKSNLWIDLRPDPPVWMDEGERRLWTPAATEQLFISLSLEALRALCPLLSEGLMKRTWSAPAFAWEAAAQVLDVEGDRATARTIRAYLDADNTRKVSVPLDERQTKLVRAALAERFPSLVEDKTA